MPGEGLGDFGGDVGHDQVRDEAVAEGMEVDDLGGGVDCAEVVAGFAVSSFRRFFGLFDPGLSGVRQILPVLPKSWRSAYYGLSLVVYINPT